MTTSIAPATRAILRNHVGLVDVIELDRVDVNEYAWFLVYHSISDRYLTVREDFLTNV